MRRSILILTLLLTVTAFSIAPVIAQCDPVVSIHKELVCNTGPGFSDNGPYYVGMKYYFWIKITVEAHADLSSVVVYDRLGAELMIEGIFDKDDVEENRYPPWEEEYTYDFDYAPYARDGNVSINDVLEGQLDKDGVAFDGFTIFWTGNSVKAHFMWDVGSMEDGDVEKIYLVVSTDTNPAGHQEYTSCGCYALNSGATVKAIVASTGRQVSAESNSIWIEVLRD